jgi:hypothetical protein
VSIVAATYCLYWWHDAQGKPHLTVNQAGIGSLVVLAAMFVAGAIALLGMSYFTPLWAIWAAIAVVAFRYLQARSSTGFPG